MDKNKLLALLEKDDLSDKERTILLEIIGNDAEAMDVYNTWNLLQKAMRSKGHIPHDLLTQYVLNLNGNNDSTQILRQIPAFEKHLRECNICREEFIWLNDEYAESNTFILETINQDANEQEEAHPVIHRENKYRVNTFVKMFRYPLISLALIAVIYMGLSFASGVFVPDYLKLAQIENKPDYFISRGRVSEDFQKSMMALQNEDYNRAIKYLEQDIVNNRREETVFYSHYILGLIHLEKAGGSFLGLFPTYNREEAEMAIKEMKLAVDKNNSGKYPNVSYDAHFFIAKGHLMLGNTGEARKYLRFVVSENGGRAAEAYKILESLR